MKCPLLALGGLTARDPGIDSRCDCLKEECAWWSTEMDQCDPTGLLPWLKILTDELQELINKMPHELQFRK